MNINQMEKNICDTVKEWQMKLGYQEEAMSLYYPMASLEDLLEVSVRNEEEMQARLEEFNAVTEVRLGRLDISHDKDRFCLKLSKEGIRYIHESWEESAFLKAFLKVVTEDGCSLAQIRETFAAFGSDVVEVHQEEEEGMEHLFYFASGKPDEYVYCIHLDEFGATYHRFTRKDYEKLQ